MRVFALLAALAVGAAASAQLTQPVGFGQAVVVERNSPGLNPSMKSDYINLYDNELSFVKTLAFFPLLRAPGAATFAASGDIYLVQPCDPSPPCVQIHRYMQSGSDALFGGEFHDSIAAMQFAAAGDLVVAFTSSFSVLDANGRLTRTVATQAEPFPIFGFDVDRDQCTVVYSTILTLRMTNICVADAPTLLLPYLPAGDFFGARFLPNGNILAGSRGAVWELDRRGGTVHRFVTADDGLGEVAIDPDGTSFWASSGNRLFRFDLENGNVIAGPTWLRNAAYGAKSMAIRGEWRAALHPEPRRRSARR